MDSKHKNHGNEGSERGHVHHAAEPYWMRAHHDWRFWVGLVLMLVAITVFALSDDLMLLPRVTRPPVASK
jgi:hypothetical protein